MVIEHFHEPTSAKCLMSKTTLLSGGGGVDVNRFLGKKEEKG